MAKKAVILLATGFEEIEAVTMIDILRRAGIDVVIAGIESLSVTGSHGITVSADKKLSDLKRDFDAAILPGGMPGAMHLHNSGEVNDFIKDMNAKGVLIAGICAAPSVVMAPIGLLDNKTATCYPGDQIDFAKNTKYKDKAVGGHGGADCLAIMAFLDAVRNKTATPIDVYDCAAWMSVSCLSEQSIALGSMPVAFPDFTNGKWIKREAAPVNKWALDAIHDMGL